MKQQTLLPLKDYIKRYDLRAQKKLGQNFLLDLNLTRKIARLAAPLNQSIILEIGPGPGGLTRALLEENAYKIIAIEMDERTKPIHAEIKQAYPNRLNVCYGDALQQNISELIPIEDSNKKVKIIANLPYNIATPLLIGWLTNELHRQNHWPPFYNSMTLMFQKEVAERIIAQPNTKAYGRLSVLTQHLCDVEKMFDVPKEAFTPPPKVTSSIVHFIPKAKREPCNLKILEMVLKATFGQRRKMIRSSLKTLQLPQEEILKALEKINIEPQRRAESLSVKEFVSLSNHLEYGLNKEKIIRI